MEAVKIKGMASSDIKLLAEFGNENKALRLYGMALNPIGIMSIAGHFKISISKIITSVALLLI